MNSPIIAYRGNMGVQTTPPFSNTYSLDFDGVDDYVGVTPNPLTDFTVSFWIKPKSGVSASFDGILGQGTTSAQGGILRYVAYDGTTSIGNVLVRLSSWTNVSGTVTNGVWANIVLTYDSILDELKGYNNGSLYTTISSPDFSAQTTNAHSFERIGLRNGLSGSEFNGGIDEVALWDSALTPTEITDIYNLGTPNDLTSLSPIAWYRMGDNGAYKSPQWLLPNNENKDKVSNYSFEFDGVDDYVDCGNSAALKPNIITVSCWIKGSANSAFTRIISQDGPTGGADAYGFYVTTATNKIVFAIKTNVTGTVTSATSGVVLDNNWHHLVGTYDGSEAILYVDGAAVGSPSAGTSVLSYGSGTLTIGCFSEPTSLPSYLFNGNIDEVAIFDSVIPIGDLWDGSGLPIDVSSVSGIVSYYKMGEDATFSGGVWTVPDQVGSNDGTSNAMTIEDRVGEAPNSENNALSYNMDLVDRVTDVP